MGDLFEDQDLKKKYKSDIRQVEILWDKITTVEHLTLLLKSVNWTLYLDVRRSDNAEMLKILLEKGIVKETKSE